MFMLTIAYFANEFPSAVEPYVLDEIRELRSRGIKVVAGSARKADLAPVLAVGIAPEHYMCLQPLKAVLLLRAIWLLLRHWRQMSDLPARVLLRGKETPKQRLAAIVHTLLGGYYAALLQKERVSHIHVHHGYFGSWIAMVAARVLKIDFSLTLHGSDLLLAAPYLDIKLKSCAVCFTISDYNRRYILQRYPYFDTNKLIVTRLGVTVPELTPVQKTTPTQRLKLLAVGRLNAVKDHAFLVRACAQLRDEGIDVDCDIAGEGPERRRLEVLIRELALQKQVTLLGHIAAQHIAAVYDRADVIVLTSRSEGLPLVLMEAMARAKIVLAPAITALPEIVIPGKTGFLYAPGALDDFVWKIAAIQKLRSHENNRGRRTLAWVRHAARIQVAHNFNATKNLAYFVDQLTFRIATPEFFLSAAANSAQRIPPRRASVAQLYEKELDQPA
jgi:glycosyltransferase involved in cell wall biosynthesis